MDINQTIEKLGLNKNQTEVYLTLLQMGSGQIQEIAEKSNQKRTTVYSILDHLIQKGLVNMIDKGQHREYFAENPQKIPNLIEREIEAKKIEQKNISEILPELASLYNAHITKPKIRTYEGLEGIKQVFDETLLLPKGSETLAYASYSTIKSHLKEYITGFIVRRAQKGITQRCIAEDTTEAREDLIKNDKRDLRITRLIDKKNFPLPVDQINIFGNKIFIASYKDMTAIVIESESVAIAMRSIFELAWIGTKNIN